MSDRPDLCTMTFRVRYAECDPMGYLHHARYWVYFEEVRTELLRRHGFAYKDLEACGVLFVVHQLACRFLRPIAYDDVIDITCRAARQTHTRVDHAYEIRKAGELTTTAQTTLACVNREGRPIVMPKELWPTALDGSDESARIRSDNTRSGRASVDPRPQTP